MFHEVVTLFPVYVALCLAAFAGGAINALAGGGTLLTFPVLLWLLPEQARLANITSKVALFPSALSAAWGYRAELHSAGRWLLVLIGPSILGGLLGSWLLTAMPPKSFEVAVPWLVLAAAVLLAVQPTVTRWTTGKTSQSHQDFSQPEPQEPEPQELEPQERDSLTFRRHWFRRHWFRILALVVLQLGIAVYGGYFGAGIGILMLAGLALAGHTHIHEMNALKSVLGAFINGVSVVYFVATGQVRWTYAIPMALCAMLGGYVAARIARRLPKKPVRLGVTVLGFLLAGYYFFQQYFWDLLKP